MDLAHFEAEVGSRWARVYPGLGLGPLRLREDWRETRSQVRIQQDGRNRWWAVVVVERPKRRRFEELEEGGETQAPATDFALPEQARVAALDPGVRSFLTGFDPSGRAFSLVDSGDSSSSSSSGEASSGGRTNRGADRIRKLNNLSEKLCRMARRPKAGAAIDKRRRHRLLRKASRIRRRVRGLVDDMHRKVIRWLLDRYDVLLLPTFEVSGMVAAVDARGRRRKIRKKTVQQLLSLSFYKFSRRLACRAEEEGAKVVRVCEAYTSKTCGRCGWEDEKLGGNKRFFCRSCGLSIGRDENGSRNIFLRFVVRAGF